jgi:glycosyltransferase involved in cell wall biosynthesis
MSSSHAISCVIPVYNDKVHLSRAVHSALGQRADVQVVLVDDFSTDGSRELAMQMARDNDNILTLALSENRGQGFARNIGVAAAAAPYIAFLDQDDEHAPGWYDHALEVLHANRHFAAVRGEVELRDVPADLSISRSDPRWPAIVGSPIWNVVVRRIAYQALGGCPGSRAYRTREGAEDVTLAMALRQHFSVAKTDYVATRHYVRPDGATAYYLRRTRVVGSRIEFLESTEAEDSGALDEANREYQLRAVENLDALRALLEPGSRGGRELLSRLSMKLIRRIAGV